MITLSTMGGLGNQMFQIAALHSLCLSSPYSYEVCLRKHYGPNQGNHISSYKNSIFSKVPFGCTDHKNNLSDLSFLSHSPSLLNKVIEHHGSLSVDGYFQSPDYFSKHFDQILDLYKPTTEEINYLNKKYDFNERSLCIGVRRGDFHHLPLHTLQSVDYYIEAIEALKDKFSFDPDSIFLTTDDPEWCRENLGFLNFTLFDENEDYLKLHAVSLCPFLVGANSTFHWWGAFLNQNSNKAFIFPRTWINGGAEVSLDHLFSKFTNCLIL